MFQCFPFYIFVIAFLNIEYNNCFTLRGEFIRILFFLCGNKFKYNHLFSRHRNENNWGMMNVKKILVLGETRIFRKD